MSSQNGLIVAGILAFCWALPAASPASELASSPFPGEKTLWHGFDRYDFLLDEQTLTIQPTKAAPD
ncbi:MAG: alpha/beta hydrolase, partial [Bryobacteraceae bacterium]